MFQKEFTDNNNVPVQFFCQDGSVYYTKYLLPETNLFKGADFDDLVYEVVCSSLAKMFGISTPEIAFVKLSEGSYSKDQLNQNKTFFEDGIILFGSKEVKDNTTLDKSPLSYIRDKRHFDSITNVKEVIKAAFFDIHINNQDRKENNYNILVQLGDSSTYFFIDHIYVFGGWMSKGNIKPTPININDKLIKSEFFHQLVSFVDKDEFLNELENYKYLCAGIPEVINEVFDTLPAEWKYSEGLKDRIIEYLMDTERTEELIDKIETYAFQLKFK